MRFNLGILSILAAPLFAADRSSSYVVAPFGLPTRQPPPLARVIQLPKVEVSISAKQVCGYTDWSTLQINLPKQLLSKKYWEKVSKELESAAKQVVMDLSHALPSMMACNLSPTWCHVMNQAELSAAFEGQLSLETCKIIDGLATNAPMRDNLRQCMDSWEKSGLSPSAARERCLTDGKPNAGPNDKKMATDESLKKGQKENKPETFDLNAFIDSIFPGEVDTGHSKYQFNSGGHLYSRRERSKSLMTELFKGSGIEIKGSMMVRNGGTFQPNIEKSLIEETKAIHIAIIEILNKMKEYHDRGYTGPQVIEKTKDLWSNKKKWEQNKYPSPIYRPTNDGSEPSLLVSPEQIYSLLPLASEGIEKNQTLEQVVDRISQATAYIKKQDELYDIHSGTISQCQHPDWQGGVAQENCNRLLVSVKASMEALELKMQGEDRVRVVQREIAELVSGVQRARLSGFNNIQKSESYKNRPHDAIPRPDDGG